MASAADIGATISEYKGDVGLGGGDFGVMKIDTQPIMDLARYTFLYNQSEYNQRQKDAEAAAKEIADYTSYDLTSGIKKDASKLQEGYDKLNKYMRDHPEALNYKNKEQWAEYKRMRNDLENDILGAKVRNTMNALREKEISDEPNEKRKQLLRQDLDKEINETDIRTPLKHSQKYQENEITLPEAPELEFDVTQTGANGVAVRDMKVFNFSKARRNGDLFSLGMNDIDPATDQGKRDLINRQSNFWVQGAEIYNSIINEKADEEGDYKFKTKIVGTDGSTTYDLDESKLGKQARGLVNLAKDLNEYAAKQRENIRNGVYKDKFEKPITFGTGALDENDYKEINYKDGISPEELALIAQYAKWKGDTYNTKVTQTDNAIQKRGQDIQRENNMLDYKLGLKRLNQEWAIANLKKDEKTKPDGNANISPVANIISSIGINKPTALKEMSPAQIAAINPNWLDDKGVLKAEFEDVQVSGGTTGDGDNKKFTIFEVKDGKGVRAVPETTINTNAKAFLEKVTKGAPTDIYSYDPNVYQQQLGGIGGTSAAPTNVKPAGVKGNGNSSDPTAGMTPAQKLEYYKKLAK